MKCPVTAAAAAISGLTRCVLPPRPCRPSKLRLLVEAHRSPGFKVSATAPDGVIEAIEDPAARFCLGVQWHPENFFRTGEFRALFEGFLEVNARTK